MKKPTLCLIFGGKSNEYDVSLHSAYTVLGAIDREKYKVYKIGITKTGEWYQFLGKENEIADGKWEKGKCAPVRIDFSNGKICVGHNKIKPDLVFPVMHGEYGEDGRIQGLFEALGVKCVGCSAFSSHTSMDKHLTKLIAEGVGVRGAQYIALYKNDKENSEKAREFIGKIGYPVFIKPAFGGSSVGVSRVKGEGELEGALKRAFEVSSKVLIEEKIDGVETEVAVLEINGEMVASIAGQIRHGGEFYTYEEKYKRGETEYIIPAEIGEKTKKELEECLKKLYSALEIKGLCRFDFFTLADGTLVFNEVNTLPGFTNDSMFPRLWQYSGYSLTQILNIILNI